MADLKKAKTTTEEDIASSNEDFIAYAKPELSSMGYEEDSYDTEDLLFRLVNSLIDYGEKVLHDPEKNRSNSEDIPLFTTAELKANSLSKAYGMQVKVLATNAECFSVKTMVRTIQENVFFISEEDPAATGFAAESIMRYLKIKNSLTLNAPADLPDLQERNMQLLEEANAKRIEQADQKSLELRTHIEKIKQEFRDTNNGKEPSRNKLAEILNQKKIEAPGGKVNWFSETVKRVLSRTESSQQTSK